MRVYILDIKNNKVTFFNKNNINVRKTKDISFFYSKFHEAEIEKVKRWIFSICTNDGTASPYLEADMVLSNKKMAYFTFLKLRKYSPENNAIYLESYIFKDITPASNHKKLNLKKPFYGVMSKEEAALFVNSNKTKKGYTFSIRLYIKNQMTAFQQTIDKFITCCLKNQIYPYIAVGKRILFENSGSEMIISDLLMSKKEDAVMLANSILNSLRKESEINGFFENIEICIGVIDNNAFYRDFKTIIDRVSRTSLDASLHHHDILFYQKNTYSSPLEISKLTRQIERLIRDNKIVYLYRPIVDSLKGKEFGYYSILKLKDSSFGNVFEANKYALQINKGKEFFALLCNNVLRKFANEISDENSKLFFPVSLNNLPYIQEILSSIKQFNADKLFLVIDELEVLEVIKRQDTLKELYSLLNDDNIHLALLIKDRDLLLNPTLYSCFDYFVIDPSISKEIRYSNRTRFSIHILIENLYKYRKPIMAIDIDGWSSIELIIKSGIRFISSDTISNASEMLLPPERKKLEKVLFLGRKYK